MQRIYSQATRVLTRNALTVLNKSKYSSRVTKLKLLKILFHYNKQWIAFIIENIVRYDLCIFTYYNLLIYYSK